MKNPEIPSDNMAEMQENTNRIIDNFVNEVTRIAEANHSSHEDGENAEYSKEHVYSQQQIENLLQALRDGEPIVIKIAVDDSENDDFCNYYVYVTLGVSGDKVSVKQIHNINANDMPTAHPDDRGKHWIDPIQLNSETAHYVLNFIHAKEGDPLSIDMLRQYKREHRYDNSPNPDEIPERVTTSIYASEALTLDSDSEDHPLHYSLRQDKNGHTAIDKYGNLSKEQ